MRTRFAPSPTGPLHLGHAYSAIVAHDLAHAAGGVFLLRIEDIDRARSRPEWDKAIFDDLAWLGLDWERPVLRQSDRMAAYRDALTGLWRAGLLFACTCNRRDIREAASAPQEGAPATGPDGIVYPGTCRGRDVSRLGPEPPRDAALRLNMDKVARDVDFDDTGPVYLGRHSVSRRTLIDGIGDVVLSRRDMGTSYHLSVVVDDAHQGITHVTRGADLFEATAIHALLQGVLSLPQPVWHHHSLVRDETGRRLAKRDDARAIATYRDEGWSAAELRALAFAQAE